MIEDQATDGVDVLGFKRAAEGFVEVGDLGLRLDTIAPGLIKADVVFGFVEILFIHDVAYDLLQHVFNGDEAGHATVLIDHHRHVIARDAEFAQQDVESL